MAAPQAKPDATAARLAALTLPEGGAWANELRRAALDRLAAAGLPGPRDEYWRWTNPARFNAAGAPQAALFDPKEKMTFDGVERLRLVFVDGAFDAEASDPLALEGVEIERLAEAGRRDIHWAKEVYGALEERGQSPVARPFATLNTAFATDGVLIRVTGRAPRPINLVYLHQSETSDAILHHVVKVESGGDLTLLECGPGAARLNKVLEVDVAEGGAFHHVRVQGRDHERIAATHIFARLARAATFKSFTLTANGRLTRNEAVIELAGDGAIAHVAGASLGDGDFHHDDTVFVTHDAVGCESRQVYKKVLRGGATGIFQGKILVKPGAQQTDGYQISQSLLLDEGSQFLVKPELEIYADDVKCSHGSTSGAIDETALFYLRARGVPQGEAVDLLVLAFVAEALDEIEDEGLRDEIRALLEGWLRRRR